MTKQKITKVFSVVLAFMLCFSICASATPTDDFKLASVSADPEINYEKSVDGKTFYIECTNVEDYPICIILSLYQGDKLVDIMMSQGYSSQATFTTNCEYDREKVMVWNSLKGMNPIVTSDNVVSPLSTVGKIEGVLVETSRNGSLNKNEIAFNFHQSRVYGNDEWMDYMNEYFGYSDYVTAYFILADSLGDVSDFLMLPSVIHFRKVATGRYEVCAITPGETGSTVKLVPDDIDSVEESGYYGGYDIIHYYPSPSSTKTSKYKIDSDADYYFNYSRLDGIAEFGSFIYDWWNYGSDAEITLIENNGDSYYDAVIIKEYEYDVVNAIDADINVIEGAWADIKVHLDDEEVSVVMKNADGEEITLDDFSKGDVIMYISSDGRFRNYDWIEIINLGQNFVTGMIDEVDAAGGVVYVNGTEYGLAGIDFPWLGDEGKFYLTRNNKIFYIDTTLNIEYAYVLNAAFSNADFTERWQLKLLTKDNEVVVYTVRDTIEFDYEEIYTETYDCPVLEAFCANVDWDGQDCDKGAHRVITYKLDSKNQIKEIETVNYGIFTDKVYNKDAQVLAVDLADNALVFNISASKSENYYATDISELSDGEEYSGYYITNLADDNDCIVITEGLEKDIEEEPEELTDMGYAYVLNAAFNDADFTECWQLQLLTKDNEVVVYTVSDTINFDYEEIYTKTPDCYVLEAFCAYVDWDGQDCDKGAHRVITYKLDSKNQIKEIETVNYGIFTDKAYDKDAQVLAVDLADNALVFNISASKSENYYATDISELSDGEEYSGQYITNINDDNDCVVITEGLEKNIEEEPEGLTDMGYAYVLDAAFSAADFAECWQLKLLTKDNEVVVYTVRDTIEFNNEQISTETYDCAVLEEFCANVDWNGQDYDKGAHRVITYKLDSKNQIKEIKTVNYGIFTDKEFYADTQVLGDAELADNTVVFNIAARESGLYFATDIYALVNGANYGGAYIKNANDESDCVVITHGGMLMDYTQDIAIVQSVTDMLIDNGETDALRVRYYTSGDDTLKSLIVVCEEDVTRMLGSSICDIIPGSLIMFHANDKDIATAVAVIALPDYDDFYMINEAAVALICDDDDSNEFVYGNINNIKTVSAGKRIETTGILYDCYGAEGFDGYITVKSSSNAYTYQSRAGKTVIHVGDWRANNVEAGEGYTFIARIIDGAVNDIITNSMFIGEIEKSEESEWEDPEEEWGEAEGECGEEPLYDY